jgi:uncharacterized protein with gpF-like domain
MSMEKQRRARLAQLIREEVKAQMKWYAMAKTREEFINSLNAVLSPALSHHYRVVLGTLNNHTDQVEKWQQHEEGFLRQFMDRLVEPTKAKGLDRRKAVEQSLKEVMQTDAARRRAESLDFQRTYKLKTLTPLPEDAQEDFLTRVREIVNEVYPA